MFEEELLEIENKKKATLNLKWAFAGLLFLTLSGIIFLIAMNSFNVGHSNLFSWFLVISHYLLMIVAAIVAMIALKKSLNAVKTFKSNKNYVAIGICILVLAAVGNELLQRF